MALLYGKAKWRLFNTATTPCDSFATVFTFDDVMPSNRSLFHLRFVLLVVSASKLDDSPQHRNVSCNAKQFNVQIERLMFCKVIRRNATTLVCTLYYSALRWAISRNSTPFVCTLYHSALRLAISRSATPFVCTLYHSTLRLAVSRNATLFLCTLCHSTLRWDISRNSTPFVCTLYHSTLRWAISRNATLFVCTLYHSTLRWAISRNATPFVRTLRYSTLPCAISRNATPFVYCIANECEAIRNWASPFHNFMFQLDMGNWTVYHLARLFMFRVFCFMKEN